MTVVVSIDAGTTGMRAFAVDEHGRPRGRSYRELTQFFPRPGWVEHDAPLAPAIVWQDRRTTERCDELIAGGLLPTVRERTGLVLDPYFFATKME